MPAPASLSATAPPPAPSGRFDRLAEIGDVAASVRRLLDRTLGPVGVSLALATAGLAAFARPGALAFGLISLGAYLALVIWRRHGIGLPLVPLLAAQHLIVYALPIVVGPDLVASYPPGDLNRAGFEVFLFCAALAGAWRFGLGIFPVSPPISFALTGYRARDASRLARLGFALAGASTLVVFLQTFGWADGALQALPEGSASMVAAMVAAAGGCGFFFLGMVAGTRDLGRLGRLAAWLLLALDALIQSSDFLLSTAMIPVAAAALGLFWSAGRIPWRFILVVAAALAFLHPGKYAMRERYWTRADGLDAAPRLLPAEMPARYLEWARASYDDLAGGRPLRTVPTVAQPAPQVPGVLDRLNNLQNLLFVIDAMKVDRIAPLHGATYGIIPSLLIPRLLWPGKPRSHEGQVILNVHFGRQDLNSTFSTYIAWGLLPEAYGNFGPGLGSLLLGLVLGLACAWAEALTARKRVLSLEGLVAFIVCLGMVNSFEMVASVLVTSLFQSIVPVALAAFPFVRRTRHDRTQAARSIPCD